MQVWPKLLLFLVLLLRRRLHQLHLHHHPEDLERLLLLSQHPHHRRRRPAGDHRKEVRLLLLPRLLRLYPLRRIGNLHQLPRQHLPDEGEYRSFCKACQTTDQLGI